MYEDISHENIGIRNLFRILCHIDAKESAAAFSSFLERTNGFPIILSDLDGNVALYGKEMGEEYKLEKHEIGNEEVETLFGDAEKNYMILFVCFYPSLLRDVFSIELDIWKVLDICESAQNYRLKWIENISNIIVKNSIKLASDEMTKI
jgi:hypothetical protein